MTTLPFVLFTSVSLMVIVAQQFKTTRTIASSTGFESTENKQQNFLNSMETSKENILRLAKINSTAGRLERVNVDFCDHSCEVCMQKSSKACSTRITTMLFTGSERCLFIRSVQVELKRIHTESQTGKNSQNRCSELIQFRFRTETNKNCGEKETNSGNDTNNWGMPTRREIVARRGDGENFAVGCVMIEVQTTWTESVEPILFELKNDLQEVILKVDFEGCLYFLEQYFNII